MKKNIVFIQQLRGLAAIFVVYYHLFERYWVDHKLIAQISLIPFDPQNFSALYINLVNVMPSFHINLGLTGVGIFFLISGFIIPTALDRQSKLVFLIRRILRIYPVYIIGFSITLISLLISAYINHIKFPYSTGDIISNYLLINDWLLRPSVDQVNWVLLIELKFYILIVLLNKFLNINSKKTIISVGIILTYLAILPTDILVAFFNAPLYRIISTLVQSSSHLIFILIGICFYNLYEKKWTLREVIVGVLLLYIFYSIAIINGQHYQFLLELLINYFLALIIFTLFYIFKDCIKPNKLINLFSQISYPLYVIHGINGYILIYFFTHLGLSSIISLILAVSIIIITASLIHNTIEQKVYLLGKNL